MNNSNQKHIKKIIDGMYRHFQYTIEDFSTIEGLDYAWGLSKVKEDGNRLYMVFTDLNKGIGNKSFKEYLSSKLNSESIIKVVIVEDSNEGLEIQNRLNQLNASYQAEDNFIILDIGNRGIHVSQKRFEEEASELGRIISSYAAVKKSEARPYITYGIIAINIIMFIISVILAVKSPYKLRFYGTNNPSYSDALMNIDTYTLLLLGAKFNTLIINGEWYRLFTCMFLHGGLIHIAANMYFLFSLGTLVERLYGKYKYILIYIASGIVASLCSFIFSNSVSVGASGAIFGLLGVILTFAIKERGKIGSGFLTNIVLTLLFNLFIGMSLPNIDNYAHVGGFLAGTAIGAFISLRKE